MTHQPPRFEVVASDGSMAVTGTGQLTDASILDVVRSSYPKFEGTRILWDLSRADLSQLTSDGFSRIAAAVRDCSRPGLHRRTAYVVADKPSFLFICRYLNETTNTRVPVEYHAFRSLAEALDWLSS